MRNQEKREPGEKVAHEDEKAEKGGSGARCEVRGARCEMRDARCEMHYIVDLLGDSIVVAQFGISIRLSGLEASIHLVLTTHVTRGQTGHNRATQLQQRRVEGTHSGAEKRTVVLVASNFCGTTR